MQRSGGGRSPSCPNDDGKIIGTANKAAIENFQRDYGFPVDGTVRPELGQQLTEARKTFEQKSAQRAEEQQRASKIKSLERDCTWKKEGKSVSSINLMGASFDPCEELEKIRGDGQ